MWIAWYRREFEPTFYPLLTGETEREVISQVNHARRRDGEWMVLEEGQDPNHPADLRGDRNGTHYGERATAREPATVVRGQFGRRLNGGRNP